MLGAQSSPPRCVTGAGLAAQSLTCRKGERIEVFNCDRDARRGCDYDRVKVLSKCVSSEGSGWPLVE